MNEAAQSAKSEEPKKLNTTVVYESRIRDLSMAENFRVSKEFVEAFNKEALELLAKSWDRCVANNRQTLRPTDL
jgi:hypothetical protein